MFRKLTVSSPVVAWVILAAGILATASAWRDRHPDTTSDFTLFYLSAEQSTPQMYAHPPGPPRGNMNPPLFQLLLRPLTAFPLPTAAAIWRGLNLLSLVICIWWLARSARERWDAADYGVLLAWAPMASTLSLNQVTWILWPLLLATWSYWRRDRWIAGAIPYGIVLSIKPFLGVFFLWLLVRRQWKAAAVAAGTAAGAFFIGLAAYGPDVTRAWIQALGDITWVHAGMNASLQGILTRIGTMPVKTAEPLFVCPTLVRPVALLGGATIVVVTLLRTRRDGVDESWTPLMVSALLASPLGWLYYIWWIVPGTKPSRLFLEAPLLWVPMAALPIALAPSGWLTLTLGSAYFWGLLSLWLHRVTSQGVPAATVDDRVTDMPLSRFGLATVLLVAIVVGMSAITAAQQSVTGDPAVGTWVLNRARSTFPPEARVESRVLTFTLEGDAIKQTILTEPAQAGDRAGRIEYIGRYDGRDVDVPSAAPPIVAMTRIDRRTVQYVWKLGERVVETDVRSVSPDGRTLTITTTGLLADPAYHDVQVYDRRS